MARGRTRAQGDRDPQDADMEARPAPLYVSRNRRRLRSRARFPALRAKLPENPRMAGDDGLVPGAGARGPAWTMVGADGTGLRPRIAPPHPRRHRAPAGNS